MWSDAVPDEHVVTQAPQAVLIVQLTKDNGRRGLYVLRQAEHGALGDGYRLDLPCPLVDVAENPPVDLPQVGQVIDPGPTRLPDRGRRDRGHRPLVSPQDRTQPASEPRGILGEPRMPAREHRRLDTQR